MASLQRKACPEFTNPSRFGEAMFRFARHLAVAVLLAAAGLLLVPVNAYALSVSGGELKDGQLRVDGQNAAPGVFVIVTSTTSSAGVRSDESGAFHVVASGFRADDCTVVVSDRQTFTTTVALAGCTPTPVSPPSPDPAATGNCVISPGDVTTYSAGDLATYFFRTAGCDTTSGPVQWAFVAGRVPVGMTGPSTQGQDAGAVSGRPITEGTYDFAVQVTDSAGATDTQTFEITVVAPRPLTVSTTTLSDAVAGRSYQVNLRADGGVAGYLWTLTSGTLPDGMQLTSRGVLAGTPSTPGTDAFTVGVTDSRGTTAEATYSLTVG
jgi:large repetitive protein